MNRRRNQERNGPAAVSLTLRVERRDARGHAKARVTARGAATHSNAVEWTRNAGARVTPFNLQRSVVQAGFGSRRIGNAPIDARWKRAAGSGGGGRLEYGRITEAEGETSGEGRADGSQNYRSPWWSAEDLVTPEPHADAAWAGVRSC